MLPADRPPNHNASARASEYTFRAVALGALLGIVFGLVTVYIALRVGLNFSASIPIAVIAITLFKKFARPSVLEQNIVQTVGSAGESIAAGAVYTFPALLFLGYQLELWRIFALAAIGGVLGVLLMVPLRHYLIVEEQAGLVYPEGRACADILVAGDRGGHFARPVFYGLGVGALYKVATSGLNLWRGAIEFALPGLRGGVLAVDLAPELLGIGCLIGLQVARVIFAGSVVSALVLIPLIYFFGGDLPTAIYPSTVPIGQMSTGDIWSSYIRYIGAGAVIAGGARLLAEALPTIIRSVREGWAGVRRHAERAGAEAVALASESDLGMRTVIIGSFLTLATLFAVLAWRINVGVAGNIVAVILVGAFGFFFVVVSARITGLMGSSANPISGITIAVLMLTCLIFVLAGWTGRSYEIVAVSVGAVVCIAASNAGTTAQDLKTGHLIGASPRLQQMGLLVGVITSVLLIGFTLMWLNGSNDPPARVAVVQLPPASRLEAEGRDLDGKRYDVYAITHEAGTLAPGRYLVDPATHEVEYREAQRIGTPELPAPQAQVMAVLIDGLLNGRMRWPLLLAGVLIAIVVELLGVRSLPFAVGMYLPISATSTLLIGALVGRVAGTEANATDASDAHLSNGVLYSSGLIAGGAIAAIVVAVAAGAGWLGRVDVGGKIGTSGSGVLGLITFGALALSLWRTGARAGPP